MMVGSILLNFWAALISFSLYFLLTFQKPYSPLNILIGSFIFALVGFFVMYIFRYIFGYIMYTPEDSIFEHHPQQTINDNDNSNALQDVSNNHHTSAKDELDNPEEIANIVRMMMDNDVKVPQ
ncbi:cytochrome b/b6 domain-containing protein [Ureibacillus massiliensis]|nr:cytochrome b/b6 domain-containing protein [Ureibacillus massiliensis]